ncbi:MAG: FecR family protein [Pseudolabrys sp.]
MLNRIVTLCAPVLAVGILFGCAGSQALAEDAAPWRVSKSSGDVWMTTSGVQEASLTSEATLKPGDSIRTGRSGRVLLTRGEETILISPNSVIALPEQQKDGLSTTIIEQAGSVLIQAEKRNVKHFQVETPYLAAVVKGTQFRVSVTERGGSVEVIEGRVEVADFKTGQFALVLPGQAAKVAALGRGGLSLSGSGRLSPIEKGTPRTSPFNRVPVPKGGFAMPADAGSGKTVHALGPIGAANNSFASAGAGNALRITAPLGEVTLNFVKATDGLAHGAIISPAERQSAATQATSNNGNLSFGSAALSANAQDSSSTGNGNAGGNGNGLALGVGNVGNGLALGVGNGAGNGLALGVGNGAGNGLALGVGSGAVNGNAIGAALAKGKAKGKE